jgi:hypothetical protein
MIENLKLYIIMFYAGSNLLLKYIQQFEGRSVYHAKVVHDSIHLLPPFNTLPRVKYEPRRLVAVPRPSQRHIPSPKNPIPIY